MADIQQFISPIHVTKCGIDGRHPTVYLTNTCYQVWYRWLTSNSLSHQYMLLSVVSMIVGLSVDVKLCVVSTNTMSVFDVSNLSGV